MTAEKSVTFVELLRHGHAGKRDEWGGADHLRPLDETGRRQADLLASDFDGDPPIAAIYSSSFRRCVMTVEPLAERLGLSVGTDVALEELDTVPITEGGSAWVSAAWLGGRALGLVDRCVTDHPGTRIVLCSHGDVVPALLATVAGRDRLAINNVRCPKGGRYRLRFSGSRCVEARAVPPPRIDVSRHDDGRSG